MSFEFLAGYHIPTIQPGVLAASPSLLPRTQEGQPQNQQQTQYQNINRYIPPGLQGTNYTPPQPSKPQKRKYDAGPGSSKNDPLAETTTDGQLVIFQGRDVSYPDDLNNLIHPLHCTLCGVQMNSSKSAKDHYESKQHDRHITQWLNKNYVEKGLTAPAVKRLIKDGPSGPDTFHCEVCDLKFGSLAHASQHYSGRKHKLVANKISQPSGSGYYNAQSKWVRTGTKYVPNNDNDGRFGIGDSFKHQTNDCDADADGTTPDTTTPTDAIGIATASHSAAKVIGAGESFRKVEPASLYCELCKVNVTSEGQMTMHLQGTKHLKKVKTLSLEESIKNKISAPIVSVQSNPSSDLSMYRTPSGSYYCECCNISMCHVAALQQHLTGRKHLKRVIEVKEKAKNEAKNKIEVKA